MFRPIMVSRPTFWLLVALALLGPMDGSRAFAQEVSKEDMRGLDEQVQEIKSDVIGIAAELGALEEKLLYPSGTQVSVFVALEGSEDLRLDSVQILLDGEPVARHLYSFAELEALRKGGVQRIYTGNVAVGEHRIEVSIAGKLPDGGDFARSENVRFTKGVEPEVVGITLAESSDGAHIQLGGW